MKEIEIIKKLKEAVELVRDGGPSVLDCEERECLLKYLDSLEKSKSSTNKYYIDEYSVCWADEFEVYSLSVYTEEERQEIIKKLENMLEGYRLLNEGKWTPKYYKYLDKYSHNYYRKKSEEPFNKFDVWFGTNEGFEGDYGFEVSELLEKMKNLKEISENQYNTINELGLNGFGNIDVIESFLESYEDVFCSDLDDDIYPKLTEISKEEYLKLK